MELKAQGTRYKAQGRHKVEDPRRSKFQEPRVKGVNQLFYTYSLLRMSNMSVPVGGQFNFSAPGWCLW